MKITIRLRYRTRFGQNLYLCGNDELFGGGRNERALPLQFVNEDFWELTIDLAENQRPKTPVNYYFLLREPDGSVIEDFGGDRKLDFSALPRGHTIIVDSWNDVGAIANVYFTEPFTNVLLRAENAPAAGGQSGAYCFNVKAPLLPKGQTICLLGSAVAMGGWNQAGLVPMQRRPEDECFRRQLDLAEEAFPVMYKYGIYDTERKKFVSYEAGENRVLTVPAPANGRLIVNDGFARLPPAKPWRGAGVAIPVFSLRSNRSFGVGEFLDLPLLADWARQAGLKVIQILPVNDTITTHTWMDSYPYNSISAFALHPLYLNLDRLAEAGDLRCQKSLAKRREQLNALPTVDYEAVITAKLAFIREVFLSQREKTFAGADYQNFFAQNKHWLEPYAAFCFLRDKFGTADFNQWPEHRSYNAKKIAALENAGDEMAFHYFTQFQLHLQLREAANYAHDQGVILKGDIAIGVAAHGADVWQEPELFHKDMQTGAPPDAFAAKGQNWGFPTYNWPAMTRDGFEWWKRRFAQMSSYFDAFRIDHILGFFRIWSIPRPAVEGILGYFVPAKPVKVAEFKALGIPFNNERFTQPFITDTVLNEIFGDSAEKVKCEFLNSAPNGRYSLKAKFATQRDVEKYFADKDDAKLKEGLYDLISNVLLIESPGSHGKEFHFRFGIEQTSSFQQLDPVTQARLKDLYIDYFYRRQDAAWMAEALPKLSALKRVTNMLICGEDLGMVPACVPEVMERLGLLGLEIQRMPKKLNANFSRPAEAPYLSVVTPSTHDMSTIRGWWLEDRKLTEQFYKQELRLPGTAPLECEPWVNREIVRQHLDSPAIWSIFQLQDLLGMDEQLRRADIQAERINVPAIPRYYWRYRMHFPLETLVKARTFTRLVKDMVTHSGR